MWLAAGLPDAQPRSFVRAGGRLVAVLSFVAATWKTQPRDHYMGWMPSQNQESTCTRQRLGF